MFPLDDLRLIISYLRGQGTADVGALGDAVLNVLTWAWRMIHPKPAMASAAAGFTIPPWLIPLLLKILGLLAGGAASASAKDDDAAGKLEEYSRTGGKAA